MYAAERSNDSKVPVNPNGTPKKAPKAKVVCAFCRKDLDQSNKAVLEQHASTHNDSWPKEKCFPSEFSS